MTLLDIAASLNLGCRFCVVEMGDNGLLISEDRPAISVVPQAPDLRLLEQVTIG